jgi:hypothetical protein
LQRIQEKLNHPSPEAPSRGGSIQRVIAPRIEKEREESPKRGKNQNKNQRTKGRKPGVKERLRIRGSRWRESPSS